jgi:hypothetical protein
MLNLLRGIRCWWRGYHVRDCYGWAKFRPDEDIKAPEWLVDTDERKQYRVVCWDCGAVRFAQEEGAK